MILYPSETETTVTVAKEQMEFRQFETMQTPTSFRVIGLVYDIARKMYDRALPVIFQAHKPDGSVVAEKIQTSRLRWDAALNRDISFDIILDISSILTTDMDIYYTADISTDACEVINPYTSPTISYVIEQATLLTLIADNTHIIAGGVVNLSGMLEAESGDVIIGAVITITVSPGITHTVTTGTDGFFRLPLTFPSAGTYLITARYAWGSV